MTVSVLRELAERTLALDAEKCPACKGDGWWAGHETGCYVDGDCSCSGVQIGCDECEGSGCANHDAEFRTLAPALAREVLRLDGLDDALREVLDVTTGWTRPLSDAEKLERIEAIANAALAAAAAESGTA